MCRDYGVSRSTGYKWIKRYLKEGPKGLAEMSRAPKTHLLSLLGYGSETLANVFSALIPTLEKCHRRKKTKKGFSK